MGMDRWRGLTAVLGGCLSMASGPAPAQVETRSADLAPDRPVPSGAPSMDELVYSGLARPGSVATLGLTGAGAPGDQFFWTQIRGTPVEIENPRAARVRFTVPAVEGKLVFVVAVTNGSTIRKTRIVMTVSAPTSPEVAGEGRGPVANPGDDQVGLVGRRITLNGSESEPRDAVGFRWMQVSGPAVAEARQEGAYYTFVPTAPGVHRFALLVGHESRVSMPAVVSVEVGQRRSPVSEPATPAASPGESPLARWASTAVASIPSGGRTASEVADVFEGVAGRVALFKCFGELQSELSRRLDVVIPADPASRQLWSGQVFGPLSQITAAEFLPVGLDLRLASAFEQPIEPPQRERIANFYRNLAEAFRPRVASAQP